MRQLVQLMSSLILFFAVAGCNTKTCHNDQAINPLLGDISFVEKFGCEPTAGTDEDLRISAHLEYVEELLRRRSVSHLPAALQARRAALLDLLHIYRVAGVFPRNYDHRNERRPCFIDRNGRICAVGYLVERTAGRLAAEKINSQYQYEAVLAMRDARLETWVQTNGITKREAAMIQPSYGFAPTPQEPITPQYGLSSAVLSGINLSLAAINGIWMARGNAGKVAPALGLAAGIGQIALGAASFPRKDASGAFYGTSSENLKAVSMVNIAIGTTAAILSTWNLLNGRAKPERRSSWGLYSFPGAGRSPGLAVSFSRKL